MWWAIAAATSSMIGLAMNAKDIVTFRRNTKRGPRCASCPLYCQALEIAKHGQDDDKEAILVLTASQMVSN